MDQLRQLLNDLTAAWGRLNPRERGLVALAAGAVTVLLLLVSTLSISSSLSRREGRIRSKTSQLEDVAKLTSGYREAEAKRTEMENRLRNNKVALFSYLDELAKAQKLEIGGMSDKGRLPVQDTKIVEQSVEVNFNHIALDKLVGFLSKVESGVGLVKVTRMQIRPRAEENTIDAWLVVTAYQLEG